LLDDHIIKEYGVSGYKTELENREGLNKVLKLAEGGLIDTLIIFNLDRIGRRTDLLPFITGMTLAGVRIISVTEGLINQGNDIDELLAFIKLWSSQGESKKTSARVKSGKLKVAKDGLWNGGKVNLGYKVVDGRLVVDEELSPIINKAFQIYITEGTVATVDYLSEYGIKKNSQTLTQMLRNSIYMGVYPYDRELYDEKTYKELTKPNEELQIVTPEIWHLARQVARDRTTSKGNRCRALNRSDCIYEGLLEHWCGNKLTIDYDYRKSSDRNMMFRCKHCRKYKKNDYKKSYSANKLIPILDGEISKLFMDLDREKLRKMYADNQGDKLRVLRSRLAEIDKEIDEKSLLMKKSNEKIKLLMLEDIDISNIRVITDVVKDTKKLLEELEDKKNSLLLDITIEENEQDKSNIIIEQFMSMKDIYSKGTNKQKKSILQLIIDRIVVKDYDDIDIYLKF
jgi:DNA invertase Pin-like site-specific DNA recombinase